MDEEEIVYSFEGDTNSLRQATNQAISLLNRFGSAMRNTTRFVGRTLETLTGVQLGDWFADATKQSIDFTETMNLFTVAMGDAVDVGTEFTNQMAEIYGMDPSNLMRYAGNFYQLADAIDMPDEAASRLSLSLTKATNDISSLFNVPIDKVFNDLSSGMQGMSRAVRKYGMDIRATTLQQTALSLGITENVRTMSEASRQGLRFITMMRQAENASGDFARTIESPANQLKIFKEQMSQLGRAVGDLFIEPLTVAIQYLNGFVMALRMIVSFVGSVLGLVNSVTSSVSTASDDTTSYFKKIGSAAGGTAKKLKALIAPFDELNVLSSKQPSGGGASLGAAELMDPAILTAIQNMELGLENVRMKALEVRDSILSFLGFKVDAGNIISWDFSTLEKNLKDKLPFLNTITEACEPVAQALQNLWGTLVTTASNAFDAVIGLWNTSLKPMLDSLVDAVLSVGDIISTLWTEYVAPILQLIGDGLVNLWQNTLWPITEKVVSLVSGVIEIIMMLWKNVLAPLVNWLLIVLSPIVTNVFGDIWTTIVEVVQGIGQAVEGVLGIFDGFIQFIVGVFTGDWKRACEGIVEVFEGVFNTVVGIVATVFNGVVGIINTVLGAITGAFNGLVKGVNKLSFTVPEWVPVFGGNTFSPNLKPLPKFEIPYMENGGVVKSPTVAMIGEGKYNEAVIPLGNSPQMKELVSDIADAVRGSGAGGSEPIVVQLYIDGRYVMDSVVRHAKSEAIRTGVNPLLGG